MAETAEQPQTPAEEFIGATRAELEQVRAQLKEIGLLVEQSQGEVDKLAQRNASIAARVHQMQAHFDTVPREDIRSAYESSQDAQQRLFTMRGQLEKLQSDQLHLKRYQEFLTRALTLLEGGVVLEPAVAGDDGKASKGGLIEQLIEAQEEERRKISRQIHDGPAQAMANFILQTEIALRLFDTDPERARQELNSLKTAAAATFAHVRDFIFDLRPMMLDDLGLIPTVRRYTEAFKEKTGLDISLVVTGNERRLESHREVMVFRTLQGLLGSVRDHAQATQAKVVLDMDQHQVRGSVEDNGRGFDQAVLEGEGDEGRNLRSLRDRLSQVRGDLEIETSPAAGTRATFSVPTGE
ncbi:MAG TPA: histidine kinase [Anaerolineales bacterium]